MTASTFLFAKVVLAAVGVLALASLFLIFSNFKTSWEENMARYPRIFLVIFVCVCFSTISRAQQQIPDAVYEIFENSCAFAGCHAGPNAPEELDLSEDFILSSLVNVPAKGKTGVLRVKAGDPVNSYLIMKLKGDPRIAGDRMPKNSQPLSPAEIMALELWIKSMPPTTERVQTPEREFAQAFPGLSISTVPTTETLEPGTFSYRIAHRWRGEVNQGFDELFGLDFGAHMFTQLSFALSQNWMFHIARSGENATFELAAKWRFLRERTDGSVPISAAFIAGVDWETVAGLVDPNDPSQTLSRSDGQRFHWFAQVPVSKQLHKNLSVLVVPGVLLNGNVNVADEDAILTVAFAGKFMLFKDFSLFVEGVPIVAGASEANVMGGPRQEGGEQVFSDAFTVGFERRVGGHVFHVYVTNSLGLAASQYMSGGDLDFLDGDFRLGFNIYRILRLP